MLRDRPACAAALRHPALKSSPGADSTSVLFLDGDDHQRIRGLLRSIIAACEPLPAHVRDTIERTVFALRGRTSIDLVADFARPVAAAVTGALLGVQLDSEFLDHLEATAGNLEIWFDGRVDKRAQTAGLRLALALNRATPAPGSGLAALREAGTLSADELLVTPVVLAHAAYENSMNFLGLAALEVVQGRAAGDLDEAAVRALAVDLAPARYVLRQADEDVELAGTSVTAGTRVAISLASAGLPFGMGRHACPGSVVAVAEAAVALRALAVVVGGTPTVTDIRWKPHPVFHGLAAATVRPS
ncbi:cytochrome P450 [Amycolatopsis suaedae]|uniref:Cytochrome P450 n=1 Tax=Amycolatopsis suaedae TaxID=2510978 RepID=A0A4Q7J9J9_9PSEU|nr:cytochrome P450 [Amycolatopsis suaedae]